METIIREGPNKLIRLADPLPCAIITPTGLCGKDAFAAHADMVATRSPWTIEGLWLLQPICQDCAKAAAAKYE